MTTSAPTDSGFVLWARLVIGLAGLGRDAVAEAMGRATAGGAGGPNRELADRFLRALTRRVVTAVLDLVDLDAVADRIDVERILDRVDLDAVADRIEVERILARVDLDAVADRIDVERIVDRVDLDAIVRRVDVEGIVRRSTSSMAGESVDALRVQGMNADRAVNGVVDRLLRRPARVPRLPQPDG